MVGMSRRDWRYYRERQRARGRRRAEPKNAREAMEALLAESRPATVVAFGDDSSDADAFAVVRAARAAGACDGLAVGVTGPRGVPEEVRAQADVVLDSPRDAARLLSALARAVSATDAAAPPQGRARRATSAGDARTGRGAR